MTKLWPDGSFRLIPLPSFNGNWYSKVFLNIRKKGNNLRIKNKNTFQCRAIKVKEKLKKRSMRITVPGIFQ